MLFNGFVVTASKPVIARAGRGTQNIQTLSECFLTGCCYCAPHDVVASSICRA